MHPLIQSRLAEMADRCVKHCVRRVARCGSATSEHCEPGTSDLEVLVEFPSMVRALHADRYFGLMEDPQRLFGTPIDLVEPSAIRNPLFPRPVIAATQVSLYETV